MNRKRLLDAARGLCRPTAVSASSVDSTLKHPTTTATATTTTSRRRPLRSFRLQPEHIQEAFVAPTPDKFHSLLCHKIRHATQRVLLASLYVGPAASAETAPKEQDLLGALQVAASKPGVQVDLLLDKNRALRPVPIVSSSSGGDTTSQANTTTSSAQAVRQALQGQVQPQKDHSNETENMVSSDDEKNNNQLFLFSVLPPSLQYFLPNPYNEVAGVFHLKAYIIDDSLILSGANLSEEYFVDRHDRYFHFTNGGGGLVDFYADLVGVLCDHSDVYPNTTTTTTIGSSRTPTTRTELLEALNKVLTEDSEDENNGPDLFADEDNGMTVAVAVPTFQAPESFFSDTQTKRRFPVDTEVTKFLLQTALEEQSPSSTAIVRLSSAYLNPTNSFLKVLADFSTIEFLTAGRLSHGFAPNKKKAGNKGKDWIPSLFDTISREACQHLEAAKLIFYERPGWTFHAKGLWLEEQQQPQSTEDDSSPTSSLAAAICGSGNYGARSETLDMESNCILVLPEGSPLQQSLQKEWTDMMTYTNHLPAQLSIEPDVKSAPTGSSTARQPAPLSWPLQACLPIIRKFL